MDDNNNSTFITFDSPLNQSSYIKVIGVGGGGNNAVNHMYRKGITGVDFIVSNTDMKALNSSPVPNKLVLGHEGLGVGGRPAKARKAAEEKADEIKELFSTNTKMVFITAGMGGGTGTGAAPVIARLAKEIKLETEDEDDPGKILVVAVVTTPFKFEGSGRNSQAQAGVAELSKYVDSILVINNEKLRSYGNLCMSEAFSMANDVLLTAVKGIAEIITLNAYVNIDFRDVNTVMEHSGTAIMGIGIGKGENRANQAVEAAASSVLLNDSDIAGAKNVLLYFSYGPDHEITMDEMGEVADYITKKTGSPDTNVIWGTGTDDTLTDEVKITLIATGFEQKENPEGRVIPLTTEHPVDAAPVKPAEPITEPTIVRHEESVEETTAAPQNLYTAPCVEEVKTPAVMEELAQTEACVESQKHIINLYDDAELKVEAARPVEKPVEDGIFLVNHVPEAVVADEPVAPAAVMEAEPVSVQPVVTPQPTMERPAMQPVYTPRIDMEAMNRADRIKAMHDLLRNDVNGPQIVESMNPAELVGEHIYEMAHSSQSEVASMSLDALGSMKEGNAYLYDNPD